MKLRGRPVLRFLDRYLGIPVVAALGVRPKRALPRDIQRIGVLRTAAIGEVLLISGILTDIRKGLPNADLVMVTGHENAQMGELVARGRCRHLAVSVARPVHSARQLRKEKFDVLIDTGPWPRFDAILTAVAGARFTIGFSSTGHARHFAYDMVIPHARDAHEIDNFRALIRPIGIATGAPPSLNVSDSRPPEALPSGPHVVFHPWSGGYRAHLREWPLEHWIDVARGLGSTRGTILISGSGRDAARSEEIASAIRQVGTPSVSIAGLSVAEMIPVLRDSKLVVGVNTSITHLASVLGAPTVMLHGPTSPKRWGPLGPRSLSVCSDFPGCGYVHHGFEFEGQREDCMLGVRVDAVVSAAHALTAV